MLQASFFKARRFLDYKPRQTCEGLIGDTPAVNGTLLGLLMIFFA